MYSFLLLISQNNDSKKILNRSRDIIDKIIPRIDIELVSETKMIKQNQIGYYIFKPSIKVQHDLFYRYSDDKLDVFFFGELYNSENENSAENVSNVFLASGITSVRLLDGSFSAIIFDKTKDVSFVVSDIIGRRKLRYFDDGKNLFLSNHDMPILATGKISTKINLVSAYSILAYDWSLNGKSLLEDIEVIQPYQYLIKGKDLEIIEKPLLHKKYKKKSNSKSDEDIVLILKNNLKYLSKKVNEIHIDLTAGLDSRSILAMALSVLQPDRIKTFTLGKKDNIEVRIAKRISKYYNITHTISTPEIYDTDDFISHSNLFAYFINGDSNSIRAVHSLPKFTDIITLKLNGLGGEIFTGYYYPILRNKNLSQLINFFETKKNKALNLEILDENIKRRFNIRIENTFHKLKDFTSNNYDLTDLYYIYERFGNWGATLSRSSWNLREFSIFASPLTIYKSFNSRTPIGKTHFIHNFFLKNYLNKFYKTPINNNFFDIPAFYNLPEFIRPYLKLLQRVLTKIQARTKNFFGRKHQSKSHNQVRSDLFRNQLFPVINDLLLSDNNFCSILLSREQIKKLLSEHKNSIKDNSMILGKLITIENWYSMVSEIMKKNNSLSIYDSKGD